MNDSPMLSKMDALMKKHRGSGDGPSALPESAVTPTAAAAPASGPPPNAWLPVLTQVIERGTPPPKAATPVATPAAARPPVPKAPAPAEAPAAKSVTAPHPADTTQRIDSALAEQLMSELAPRLSAVMEQQVASELRKNLDQTVATLLGQLDVNVREIVRDAVAEKLKKPHDPSL